MSGEEARIAEARRLLADDMADALTRRALAERSVLDEVRMYAEALVRSADRDMQMVGADLMQILGHPGPVQG